MFFFKKRKIKYRNLKLYVAMNFNTKPKLLCGTLYKYTNVMKGWQVRYFVLEAGAGHLHYYLCEGDKPETHVPRGSVHLAAAVVCPSDEDSKTFTVNCANSDILKLRATDARARQEWVNGLRAVAESHTKAIEVNCPRLPPREHLAASDAMVCVRAQLQQTERAGTALCRALENVGTMCFTDRDLLLLKATSAASVHCLLQCLNILQRNQQPSIKTGIVTDDE